MIKCDDCQMDFNSNGELEFDNETGIYSCPYCGGDNIMEISEIKLEDQEDIK